MKLLAALVVALTAVACKSPAPTPQPAPDAKLKVIEIGEGPVAFVLLHGWGARGDDLAPLAKSLAAQHTIRFVLPEAPRLHKRGGRSWFDPFAGPETKAQVAASRTYIDRTLDSLHARGYADSDIVLGGFSQGAIMTVDVARQRPGLRALVLLSGTTLPIWTDYRGLANTPVFITHGRRDRILDFDKAAGLAETMKVAGAKVTWHPFDGGHTIPEEAVIAMRTFLTRTASAAASPEDEARGAGGETSH